MALAAIFYTSIASWWRQLGAQALAALFGALAWVLLTARSRAALQTHLLAATSGGQCHAWQWLGSGSCFAVCFCNDLIAH